MGQPLRIDSIEAENLRGYKYTVLKLETLTILVGENNEGKSSLLKMFERLLTVPMKFWMGDRLLSAEEFAFWHPANTQNRKAPPCDIPFAA